MMHTMNAAMSVMTIVDPTGVSQSIERIIPTKAQQTDRIAEQIVTERKLFRMRIAESAGKITSADTRSEPTRFMARTIITAIIVAIRKFRRLVLVPTAFAKLSSNVT